MGPEPGRGSGSFGCPCYVGWLDPEGRFVVHVGRASADNTRADCGSTIPFYAVQFGADVQTVDPEDLEIPPDDADRRVCSACVKANRDLGD